MEAAESNFLLRNIFSLKITVSTVLYNICSGCCRGVEGNGKRCRLTAEKGASARRTAG
jgi:hypothetical protein